MKDKLEKILSKYPVPVYCWDSMIKKLSTLIQEERKEAVEGLLNKCCNKCRDLIYSNYALQGQEKKKRSVEKLVREK